MRRLMLDMTQTELAAALGITFQQVQKRTSIFATWLEPISKLLTGLDQL